MQALEGVGGSCSIFRRSFVPRGYFAQYLLASTPYGRVDARLWYVVLIHTKYVHAIHTCFGSGRPLLQV